MRHALIALLTLIAAPAAAERLDFDPRVHAALAAAMADKSSDAVYFEDRRPRYLLDRILIRGRSAQDWDEALEIVVYPHPRNVTKAMQWYEPFRAAEDAACPSTWSVLTSEDTSITFTRSEARCTALAGQTRTYRAIVGKRDVFVLGGLNRGAIEPAVREAWLTLFATARLAG